MLAYGTPANGVLAPVTNLAVRDREAGTVTVNSSVGAWKKLERTAGHRLPASKLVYRLDVGFATRQRYRAARRRGLTTGDLAETVGDSGGEP